MYMALNIKKIFPFDHPEVTGLKDLLKSGESSGCMSLSDKQDSLKDKKSTRQKVDIYKNLFKKLNII